MNKHRCTYVCSEMYMAMQIGMEMEKSMDMVVKTDG